MAEQDFTKDHAGAENATEQQRDASLFNHLQRLEARFQDAYLTAANDEDFGEQATYPIDAFYRACARHLKFGRNCELEDIQADAANDEQNEAPRREIEAQELPRSMAKGPSYAL